MSQQLFHTKNKYLDMDMVVYENAQIISHRRQELSVFQCLLEMFSFFLLLLYGTYLLSFLCHEVFAR